MVVGILVIIIIVVVVAAVISGSIRSQRAAERRVREDIARSRSQTDDLFLQARIRMEEEAGWRQPGERRIGDGIRGSWRSW